MQLGPFLGLWNVKLRFRWHKNELLMMMKTLPPVRAPIRQSCAVLRLKGGSPVS